MYVFTIVFLIEERFEAVCSRWINEFFVFVE